MRRGIERAVACLLSGSIPVLAAAQSAAPAAAPAAQTASPGGSASDTQQRLQRLVGIAFREPAGASDSASPREAFLRGAVESIYRRGLACCR